MMSVYAITKMRTGNSAGARVLRAIAINTATIKMHGVVHAKILMSSTKA